MSTLSRELFVKGVPYCPWPLRGDAYTVSSDKIVSPRAKERSVYTLTNRVGPLYALPKGVAGDGRMVLYGLTDFIQRELTRPVTIFDVEASRLFLEDAHVGGGPLDCDVRMWYRVVSEYDGYLPIRISALPECSTFWANEPFVQVTSLGDGFGEIAAIVEALLVGYVANATARLTLTRHLLERVRETVRKHHPTYKPGEVDGIAQMMIHDFGMRASSTPQESEIYGRAHLLCFNGTDTFNGAFQAWATGAERPVGTSILALAHRIVMGYDGEEEAYQALVRATDGLPGSYVADCYDFHASVTNFLVNIAKKTSMTVVRPDSGDAVENVLFVVREALKAGLYDWDERMRPQATTLRFIQGDSMTWDKIRRIMDELHAEGVDPTGWGVFGIGGWLRNTPNRDIFSSAYKLAAVGGDNKPVVKLSDTLAKVSIPGPNIILRPSKLDEMDCPTVFFHDELIPENGSYWSAMRTFYDASLPGLEKFTDYCLEGFDNHRYRCLTEFDSYADVPADRGTTFNSPLSDRIRRFQADAMKAHGKSVDDYRF